VKEKERASCAGKTIGCHYQQKKRVLDSATVLVTMPRGGGKKHLQGRKEKVLSGGRKGTDRASQVKQTRAKPHFALLAGGDTGGGEGGKYTHKRKRGNPIY